MRDVTLGIFENQNDAEHAIKELESRGFSTKNISILMKEPEGYVVQNGNSTAENVTEGAVSGATTGSLLGGLAGLLIGIGAIAIPGVGGLLIGGPLAVALGLTGAAATTVSGAVTGAAAGGLVGALAGLGLPEDRAEAYASSIEEGGVMIAVSNWTGDPKEARDVLKNHGATQVDTL